MITCPKCQQKLKLNFTMLAGTTVICPTCSSSLKIVSRDPDRVELTGEKIPNTKNAKPESYQ
jgi:Zn finger protein HypA/HybF involved in hydrogenase expression